eukprot:Nitzschia sp. Nitz4//scaffold53_size117307//57684//61073//NITZ4_003771-RA/size117307-processed-gene-0.32-mRNA-1//-1//CDS//3329554208//2426//frame0
MTHIKLESPKAATTPTHKHDLFRLIDGTSASTSTYGEKKGLFASFWKAPIIGKLSSSKKEKEFEHQRLDGPSYSMDSECNDFDDWNAESRDDGFDTIVTRQTTTKTPEKGFPPLPPPAGKANPRKEPHKKRQDRKVNPTVALSRTKREHRRAPKDFSLTQMISQSFDSDPGSTASTSSRSDPIGEGIPSCDETDENLLGLNLDVAEYAQLTPSGEATKLGGHWSGGEPLLSASLSSESEGTYSDPLENVEVCKKSSDLIFEGNSSQEAQPKSFKPSSPRFLGPCSPAANLHKVLNTGTSPKARSPRRISMSYPKWKVEPGVAPKFESKAATEERTDNAQPDKDKPSEREQPDLPAQTQQGNSSETHIVEQVVQNRVLTLAERKAAFLSKSGASSDQPIQPCVPKGRVYPYRAKKSVETEIQEVVEEDDEKQEETSSTHEATEPENNAETRPTSAASPLKARKNSLRPSVDSCVSRGSSLEGVRKSFESTRPSSPKSPRKSESETAGFVSIAERMRALKSNFGESATVEKVVIEHAPKKSMDSTALVPYRKESSEGRISLSSKRFSQETVQEELKENSDVSQVDKKKSLLSRYSLASVEPTQNEVKTSSLNPSNETSQASKIDAALPKAKTVVSRYTGRLSQAGATVVKANDIPAPQPQAQSGDDKTAESSETSLNTATGKPSWAVSSWKTALKPTVGRKLFIEEGQGRTETSQPTKDLSLSTQEEATPNETIETPFVPSSSSFDKSAPCKKSNGRTAKGSWIRPTPQESQQSCTDKVKNTAGECEKASLRPSLSGEAILKSGENPFPVQRPRSYSTSIATGQPKIREGNLHRVSSAASLANTSVSMTRMSIADRKKAFLKTATGETKTTTVAEQILTNPCDARSTASSCEGSSFSTATKEKNDDHPLVVTVDPSKIPADCLSPSPKLDRKVVHSPGDGTSYFESLETKYRSPCTVEVETPSQPQYLQNIGPPPRRLGGDGAEKSSTERYHNVKDRFSKKTMPWREQNAATRYLERNHDECGTHEAPTRLLDEFCPISKSPLVMNRVSAAGKGRENTPVQMNTPREATAGAKLFSPFGTPVNGYDYSSGKTFIVNKKLPRMVNTPVVQTPVRTVPTPDANPLKRDFNNGL